MFAGHVDECLLCCADRRVGGLAGHGGRGKEFRSEVLDGQAVMVGHDPLRPLPAGVLALPGDLLVEFRGVPLRFLVALRSTLASLGFPAGRHPLIVGQTLRGVLAVLGMREVVGVGGGGRGLPHAPVDADIPPGGGQGLGGGHHDERGVPVAETVAVDAHRGRRLGQVPRPHHAEHDPARQVQAAVLDPEPTLRVVQRRVGGVLLLALRHPRPLPHGQLRLDVLQRFRTGLGEVAAGLLLRHRTALTQPRVRGAGLGQHLVEAGRAALLLVGVGLLRSGAALVPDPPAPRPLRLKAGAGGRRHAQTVGVPGAPDIIRMSFCRLHDVKWMATLCSQATTVVAWMKRSASPSDSPSNSMNVSLPRRRGTVGRSTARSCTSWRSFSPIRQQSANRSDGDSLTPPLLQRSSIRPRSEGRSILGGLQ